MILLWQKARPQVEDYVLKPQKKITNYQSSLLKCDWKPCVPDICYAVGMASRYQSNPGLNVGPLS